MTPETIAILYIFTIMALVCFGMMALAFRIVRSNETLAHLFAGFGMGVLPSGAGTTIDVTPKPKPSIQSSLLPAKIAAPSQLGPVMTQGLVDGIKTFEGYSEKAYPDIKQYSIGWGTKATSRNEVITKDEAEKRLETELQKAVNSVEAFAPNAPIGIKQALASLTYNSGPLWESQGLGNLIKAGNYEKAKSHFSQYNHADGKVNDALTKRRAKELTWFDHPL